MPTAARRLLAVLVLALSLAQVPHTVDAQPPGDGTICGIARVKALPGRSFQLEEAMQRHLEVVREAESERPFFVFQIVSGEHSGQDYVELPGHAWSGFESQPMHREMVKMVEWVKPRSAPSART